MTCRSQLITQIAFYFLEREIKTINFKKSCFLIIFENFKSYDFFMWKIDMQLKSLLKSVFHNLELSVVD